MHSRGHALRVDLLLAVFRGSGSDNPNIKALRGRLLAATRGGSARPRSNLMAAQVRLGEMVKNALEARKGDAEKELTSRLAGIAADVRKNKTFGDAMFANLLLLVERPARRRSARPCRRSRPSRTGKSG